MTHLFPDIEWVVPSMSKDEASARSVAEDLLERSGRGMINDDFDVFLDCFAIPYRIETFDGTHTIETFVRFRACFEEVNQYYRENGVTELYRRCIEARFRDSDTIESTHEARIVGRGVLLLPPYPVLSIIRKIDGAWKLTEGIYATDRDEGYTSALMNLRD